MSKENKNIITKEKPTKNEQNILTNPKKPQEENGIKEQNKDKINKPNDLKNFDAISHFKENIINYERNCREPIKESSYYCFTCKHSVCSECGVYDHKEHLLIQRDNCLNYDKSFFNEIAKVIEKGLTFDNKKIQIKKDISKSILLLKEELDKLEKEKLKEIDEIFDNIKNNYIELQENFTKTKESIQQYYKNNKKFFNINVVGKENDVSNKEVNNILELKTKKSSSSLDNNYLNDNEIGDNRDIENAVFIMNFELMNLCDNKNLQILEISNDINNKITNISTLIDERTNNLKNEIKNTYLNFDCQGLSAKFDDFYWDVKIRCEKYSEHIQNYKKTLYDIYKRNGSFEKLKDLLGLFDSKNNKGKDVLFNQQYFINNNDIVSGYKNMNSKLFPTLKRIRSSSKKFNKSNNSLTKSSFKLSSGKITERNKPNNLAGRSIDKYTNKTLNNDSKFELRQSLSNNILDKVKRTNTLNIDNIILNQRILQRFFAYSILDYYSKYFKIIRYDDNLINEVINEEDYNIYNKFMNKNGKRLNVNTINNHNLKNNKNKRVRSASLLSNFSQRFIELKEKVKPIIKTNYIQIFDPMTTKITKVKLNLTKEEHGYTTFPDGCRHILIDSFLYVTGGSDNCGFPINVVLMINIKTKELVRLSNLNETHSYHSIEYLENFDSIIIVGGENSTCCEIMDLDNKKWTKLPSLNYARANSNIYYNNITSDLFVLFGMEGEMNNKPKNMDIIEVLELNDIVGGWMKVDYYKSVGLDMKKNYCITLPFTRDKLVIYGGSTARSIEKKIFALFDMIKNEIIKVDNETMDLIKLEENKIRSFDKAIEKMM